MRRTVLYLILCLCISLNLSARDLTFRGESLATALAALRDMNTGYTINFIANDLEQLPVHATLNGLSLPDAVKRLCKGQPVKAKIKGKQIFIQYDKNFKVRDIKLDGTICDARSRNQLTGAKVELLGEDSVLIDSLTATRQYMGYYMGEKHVWETAEFSFTVPAIPARYIFRITREDYRTVCYNYVLDRVGRREVSRNLSPFYLHKESKTLQEVTVTASRVRFYYKGDTIVYNADEFHLAEGSMLDGLLRQLPGMELKDDGRIYHNGKFVDDLLLNGKDFFRGDRKQMLENLPAYIVKDVAIYDKQTDENEWLGRKDESTQRHVIDVRLKKEYMIGWIANVDAGAGIRQDETPYLARLFAMRQSDHSWIRLIAKTNNLDDDNTYDMRAQKEWKPGASNRLRHSQMAEVGVHVENREKTNEYYGFADVKHSTERLDGHTTSQTFLPGGDTYDHSFTQSRNEEWRTEMTHEVSHEGKQLRLSAYSNTKYHHFDNTSSSTSGLFSAPITEVSHQLLSDIFSSTSPRPNLRDTLINRQLREGLGTGHEFNTKASLSGTLKMKRSNDVLRFSVDGMYEEIARQTFSRQNTSYFASQQQPLFRHQYTDLPPRRNWELSTTLGYTLPLGQGWRQLYTYYKFTHSNQRERENIYRLDRLTDADSSFSRPIDQLPSVSEYQQVIDRTNSHLSHFIDNKHHVYVNIGYEINLKDSSKLLILSNSSVTLHQQQNAYERGAINTTLRRLSPEFDFYIRPWIRKKSGDYAGISLDIYNEAPDLLNEAAITDDTDPMNIRIGNPDLRYALRTDASLYGTLFSLNKRMDNRVELNYGFTHNAIGMGQTYDRQTGIRTYRPTNVNGNWDAFAKHTLNYSFGDGKKHSAQMVSQFSYRNSVDLMEEALQSVRTATLSFAPKLSLALGKHTLGFSSEASWNRYTSDSNTLPSFGGDGRGFSAWQYRIGADAIIHLPWKFDLTTDLTLYGRTGYADASLNTSDLVWNARLARPVFKGKWVVMVDGFDILGQLSNVTRTINAQGRTETYTNVLPRYVLLHIIYKFNKQPKKK